MKQFVIFGSPGDPHIARVCRRLAEHDVDVAIYSPISDHSLFLDPVHWTVDCKTLTLPGYSGRAIEVDISNSLWWLRNKYFSVGIFDEDDQRRYFESKNREAFSKSIITFSGAQCLNFGHNVVESNRKLVQLSIAQKLGFQIPKTIISSSRTEIADFVRSVDGAIAKPLDEPGAPPINSADGTRAANIFIMTNEITAEEIAQSSDEEFASAPFIVQEKVEKRYELRVFAFRDDVLAFQVNSQLFDLAKVDWRRGERVPNMFTASPLPIDNHLAELTREYLRATDLDFGVFDFAVDLSGAHVFFECNPSGQWGALETDENTYISQIFSNNIMSLLGHPSVMERA